MKKKIKILRYYFLFFIFILNIRCSTQNRTSNVWIIKKMKTNYLPKSLTDKYELPKMLNGKHIEFQNSKIILSEIYKNHKELNIHDEFGDTILFDRKIYFKRCEDNILNVQYPGDEFLDCAKSIKDTCFMGGTFLKLLGIKEDGVDALISTSGKHSNSRCVLFILKKDKEIVLYSENDFLLLFLSK